MARRLFYIFIAVVAVLLLIVALHPWILPRVLPSVAGLAGFEVGSAEADGYGWLILREIEGQVGETRVVADVAVIRQPAAWLLDLRSPAELESPLVKVAGVRIDLKEARDDTEPSPTPHEAYEQAGKALDLLERWAPWMEVQNVEVTFREYLLRLDSASFRNGELRVNGAAPQWEIGFEAAAQGLQQVAFEAGPFPHAGMINGTSNLRADKEGYTLESTLNTAFGVASSSITVPQDKWVPRQALVTAPQFEVPAEALATDAIGKVGGKARAAWDGDEWGIEVQANGQAIVNEVATPVTIDLRAVGDLEKATLNSLLVSAPFGRLELLHPTVLTAKPPFLMTQETSVRLRFNPTAFGIDDIPSPLVGRFDVRLQETGGSGQLPTLEFTGRTSSIGRLGERDIELQLAGMLEWPRLQLTRFEADLGKSSAFTATADINFQEKVVTNTEGRVVLGAEWLSPYLAEGARVQSAKVEWAAHGDFFNLEHDGVVQLTEPAWEAHSVELLELRWRGTGAERLNGTLLAYDEDLEVIALEMGIEGDIPAVDEAVTATAGLEIAARLDEGELRGLIALKATEVGIEVQSADITLGDEPILHSTGFLPISLVRSAGGLSIERLKSGQQVSFVLDAQLQEGVQEFIPVDLPVEIGAISAQASIEGAPDALRGFLNVQLDRIVLPELGDGNRPLLEQVELRAAATRNDLRIEELRLLLNQQPLIATAEMPVHGDWVALIEEDPVQLLKSASARVVMQDYPLAIIEEYLPRTFADTGSLSVDISLSPGLKMGGEVNVQGLRTRPLEGGATLAITQATLTLDGRQASISHFDALLGRRKLNLGGSLNFEDMKKPTGGLHLAGQRLPLVLSENLLLRGDLDVEITLPADQAPMVRGQLNLREGLVLQDLRSLAGGPEGAPVRPPYFSVEASPFNEWRLDLKITGENFLRVETPVFSGKISADASLGRTLGDPLLVGEAIVETGIIRFPFAGLRVEGGGAFITRQSPHTLQLDVPAEGGAAGYTISMHVGGNSEEPEIEFTSSPPLQQEEILLLVTAGILPEQDDLGRSQAQALALYIGRGLFRDLTGPGSGEGIGDRLTVESGRSLSEEGRETYSVEYKLTDRLSIEGGYDIYDQYNIGIRWNLLER